MNSNRFTELLNLYLDDKATGEEREELMQLLRESGQDETLSKSIHAMLLTGQVREDIDSQTARKMLKGIIAGSNEEQKVIAIRTTARTWRWVAAAAFMIAVSAGWWTSRTESVPQQLITLQKKEAESAFFTGKQFVRLPDGSTVLLNEESELSYSTSFGKTAREVTLIGEAYFDVRHDSSKPFKVFTGQVTTTVLGTAFNVKAYPGQGEIKVTVSRGRVQVGDAERTFAVITPDQQISVNTATNDFIKTNLKAETAQEWKSQYLILDDVSMEDAAKIIGDKYKIKIILMNDNLKICRISASFLDGEDLDQVLTVVSGVVQAAYTMHANGHVEIEGNGCK